MQVESIVKTTYVSSAQETSQTQESQKNSEQRFNTSEPFDINSFTYEDYKAINYDDLEKWIKNSNLSNEKEVLAKTNILSGTTIMTNDDTFNRVLFEKTNESYNKTGKSLFLSVFVPLADILSGGGIVEEEHSRLTDPIVAGKFKNDPNNWSNSLTGSKRTNSYFFEIDNILSNMEGFPEFYSNLDSESKSLIGDIRDTYQALDGILAEYSKRKDDQNAALEAFTKNNKPSPIFS